MDSSSVVIGNLNFVGIAVSPYEANPELIVDADTMLTGAIPL
jgi:hypothetical protein